VAVLLGTAGAMIFCAMLLGQIGQQLGGHVGLEVGETLGGLLGPLLGWITITPFFFERAGRRSWEIRNPRHWIGLLVSMGLANAGVLWLLLGNELRGTEVCRLSSGLAFSEAVFGVALTPDDSLALSAEAWAIPLWEEAQASHLRRFPIHHFSAPAHPFSMVDTEFSENDWKLQGPPERVIRVWDLASGRELSHLEVQKHDRYIQCFVISPDSRHVLAGSRDGTLHLWELGTGKEVWHFDRVWQLGEGEGFSSLNGAQDAVLGLAFTPDGRQFLSVGLDSTIRIWSMADFQEQRRLNLPVQSLSCAVFSADARQMLSGGQDATVRLWDVESGQELCRCQGHRNTVTSVAFSPDGRRALSGSKDWTLRLWDLASGRQVCVCRGHTGIVHSVAFCADGATALSGSCDGTVRVWQLPQ
jgi:WD40 repeat protein